MFLGIEKIDKKFKEFNPLAAEVKYVVNYLLDLINQDETFMNTFWFSIKVLHHFCSYNICRSSFAA